jgi:hypothetical protein
MDVQFIHLFIQALLQLLLRFCECLSQAIMEFVGGRDGEYDAIGNGRITGHRTMDIA